MDATILQSLQVGGRGGMGEHVAVHGRGDHNRAFGAQEDSQQQAVAAAFRHAGEGVGRRGGHEYDISPEAEFYVVGPGSGLTVFGEFAVNGITAERAQGQGGDEFLGARRHHDTDLRTGLDQFTDDVGGFVGGDAPGHAQDDAAAREGSHGGNQLSRCWKRRLRRSSRSRRISSWRAASAASSSSVGIRKYTLPSSSSLMATLCGLGWRS